MTAFLLVLLLFTLPAALAAGPEAGPCVPCDLLFASTGGTDGRLFTIDPTSGDLNDIGAVATFTDIALTPDGRLYGLGTGGVLHELDPCTAEASPLDLVTTRPGATGTTRLGELLTSSSFLQAVDLVALTTLDLPSAGWCGFTSGDLALNPCDGTAWQVSRGPACPCPASDAILERLDPVTGNLIEQVTCLPFPELFGLAFDSSCTLWTVDATSGALIRVDPITHDWSIVPSAPLFGVLGMASVPCSIEGTCAAGGPYSAACGSAACSAGGALVELDAAGSALPSASPLRHDWTVTCPGGGSASGSGASIALCLAASCGEVCDVELVVSNVEGRRVSCLTTLTIDDDAPPSLAGLPLDAAVRCDAVPPPPAIAASDACDPSPSLAFEELRIDGDCPGSYELLRTWTATDACGNSTTATRSLAVVDAVPPLLVGVPADAVVDCGAVPPPPEVVATDACDPSPSLRFEEVRVDGDCPGNYLLLRTWTGEDACGNSAVATRQVEVVDTTPPTIDENDAVLACLWPPNHRFVSLPASLFAPTISDDCSEPVTWRLFGCESDEPADGLGDGHTEPDCRVENDGTSVAARAERLGNRRGRTYSVTVVASDACGNESEPVLAGRIRVPHDQREHESCLAATGRR